MKLAFTILFWLLSLSMAQATTWYVGKATGDSDSNSCASAQSDSNGSRKRTIAGGLSCVGTGAGQGAGHIVDVRVGTYVEGIDTTTFPTGTSWSTPFTLRGHAGETVTWANSGELNLRIIQSGNMFSIVKGFVFDGQNLSTTVGQITLGNELTPGTGANFFRLDGNTIINTHITAIYISHTVQNSEIVNNTIHSGEFYCLVSACGGGGAYAYGIYMNGSNDLIEHNEFYDLPSYSIHIYSGWGSPSNNIVRFNKIHDFGSFYAGTGASPAGGDPGATAILAYHSGGTNNQIYGNIIYNGTSCIAMNMDAGKVYNNTCSRMTGTAGGLGGIGLLGDTLVKNNIISNISGGAVLFNFAGGGIPGGVTANLCPSAGTGCSVVSNNPAAIFVNPATFNFHLLQTSPANDVGVNLGSPYNIDYDGQARPGSAAWDLGAYEYQSGVTITVAITGSNLGCSLANCVVTGNSIVLSGTTTAVTAGAVTFSTDRGSSGSAIWTPATPPSGWTTNPIALKVGLNHITITSTDATSNIGTAALTVTYAPTFPGNSLVGAWGFETGSGTTATDSSGNGNNGILTNGPAWTGTSGGRYGNAITFDGINDSIVVADANSLDITQSWTISAWVKPASTQTVFKAILHKNGDTNSAPYELYASTSAFGGCTSGASAGLTNVNGILGPRYSACANTPIPPGNWTFVAATYDGTNLSLYRSDLNSSAFIAITPASGYIEPSDGSAAQLVIGGSEFGEFFQGELDEIRLYNWAIPLTAGGNTALGSACALSSGVQTNIATPSIIGDANCAIAAVAAPARLEIGAAAGVLEIGAGTTFEIQGQ